MIRYLAIDPSSRISGYAIFEYQNRDCTLLHHGVFSTNKLAYSQRFPQIDWWLEQIYEQWRFNEVCYESAHGFLRIHSLHSAIQVITEFCKRKKIRCTPYTPSLIKRSVTGDGRASKDHVASVVELVWQAQCLTDHESDAIAVGQVHGGYLKLYEMAGESVEVCGANKNPIKRRRNRRF